MATHFSEPAAPERPKNCSVLDYWPSVVTSVHADHMPKGTPAGTVLQHAAAALGSINDALYDIETAQRAAQAAAPPQPMSAAGTVAHLRAPKTGFETQLDTAMLVRFQRIGPQLDRSVEAMKKSHAEIEKKIGSLFAERSDDRYGGEVRGYFSYHHPKETDRFAAALKAIKDLPEAESMQVARALLRPAPSFLSGMSAEFREKLRNAALRRHAPVLLDQLTRSSQIINHVERSKESFVQRFSKMRPKQGREREVDLALGKLAGTK